MEGNNKANGRMKTTKIISSNPTLNFLLSTPINSSEPTQPTGSNKKAKRIILNPSSESEVSQQPKIAKTSQKRNKSPKSVSSLTSKSISYSEEIRKMMHSFGDVRYPSLDSARMIESIVQHQMILLLMEAQRIAKQRQSRHITMEDFLFLLKHDRHKLAKLIRYLKFKDYSKKHKLKVLYSMFSPDNNSSSKQRPLKKTKKNTRGSLYNDIKNELEEEYLGDDANDGSHRDDVTSKTFESSSTSNQNPSKRIKLCYNFLFSVVDIPQYGDLEKFFEPDFVDKYTFTRNRRLNEFTQSLSVKDYLFYQSCRSVTFFGTSTGAQTISPTMFHKFQDWILNEYNLQNKLELRPDQLGWEVIQYFAHETVAILVELALMVRRDQQRFSHSHPDTVDVLPAKHFWQSSMNTIMNISWKTAKGDPMLNEYLQQDETQQSDEIKYQNFEDGESSQSTDEQYVTDVLKRASEKVMVFQSSNSSINNNEGKSKIKFQSSRNGITPDNILEVMRRFESGWNIFNRFSRSHTSMFGQNMRKRILCL